MEIHTRVPYLGEELFRLCMKCQFSFLYKVQKAHAQFHAMLRTITDEQVLQITNHYKNEGVDEIMGYRFDPDGPEAKYTLKDASDLYTQFTKETRAHFQEKGGDITAMDILNLLAARRNQIPLLSLEHKIPLKALRLTVQPTNVVMCMITPSQEQAVMFYVQNNVASKECIVTYGTHVTVETNDYGDIACEDSFHVVFNSAKILKELEIDYMCPDLDGEDDYFFLMNMLYCKFTPPRPEKKTIKTEKISLKISTKFANPVYFREMWKCLNENILKTIKFRAANPHNVTISEDPQFLNSPQWMNADELDIQDEHILIDWQHLIHFKTIHVFTVAPRSIQQFLTAIGENGRLKHGNHTIHTRIPNEVYAFASIIIPRTIRIDWHENSIELRNIEDQN